MGGMVSDTRKAAGIGRSPNFVDPITIGFDRLHIIIDGFKRSFVDRMLWLAPGSVAITLLTTLIVSDFKDKYGLSANDWRDATIAGLLAFTAWSVVCFLRSAKWRTTESLMDEIGGASQAPTRNYALTFFKSKDDKGGNRVLVYFDKGWDCYLVPYVGLQPGNSDPDNVAEPTGDRFGIPKHAFVAEQMGGHEVRSVKKSESSHEITNYRFMFFRLVVVDSFEKNFRKPEFVVQERPYKWMAVEEILSHPKTAERNGEVFRYIRDHRQFFFNDSQPQSIAHAVKG